jgi:uncharacterized protein YndB with AHSA1/START domain
MSPAPRGWIEATARGRALVLTRTFHASLEDVWASLTEPERTAQWFAAWTGKAEPGAVIRCRMVFEEGDQETEVTIDACEPPRHLAVSTDEASGGWHLEARLAHEDGTTTLTLMHHLDRDADPGMIGPGWEYYLDLLVASRTGRPRPAFDTYFPAQMGYYRAQDFRSR